MANWKPIGETWGKRKGRRHPVCGAVWWIPGDAAPVDIADPNVWERIGWIDEKADVQIFGPGALYDSVIFHPPKGESSFDSTFSQRLGGGLPDKYAALIPDTEPPTPEPFLRPGQISGKAGRWENCTPELLASGVDCATAPRRPGPSCLYPALVHSHQHWVVHSHQHWVVEDVATGPDDA